MQSVSNMYVSHLILYLHCKFHGNIPNDCQDIANLLLGYFNLGHPVHFIHTGNLQNTATDNVSYHEELQPMPNAFSRSFKVICGQDTRRKFSVKCVTIVNSEYSEIKEVRKVPITSLQCQHIMTL